MKCERTQPVCMGLDDAGELIWEITPMPRWQMELLRINYRGDFAEQWMYLILTQQGFEWGETHVKTFAGRARAPNLGFGD